MKNFILVVYNYSEIYEDMLAYLEPEDKDEKGFQVTLRDLIVLEYQVY
ncbi:hypothetical protein [Flavobacterium sp. T12S277]